MFAPQYPPLTPAERDTMNRASTSQADRTRLYARDLLATADAYTRAADAVGLRKDAAKYLASEGARLHREGMAYLDMADAYEASDEFNRAERALQARADAGWTTEHRATNGVHFGLNLQGSSAWTECPLCREWRTA